MTWAELYPSPSPDYIQVNRSQWLFHAPEFWICDLLDRKRELNCHKYKRSQPGVRIEHLDVNIAFVSFLRKDTRSSERILKVPVYNYVHKWGFRDATNSKDVPMDLMTKRAIFSTGKIDKYKDGEE